MKKENVSISSESNAKIKNELAREAEKASKTIQFMKESSKDEVKKRIRLIEK